MNKNYSELNKLNSFEERFEYLRLYGAVGRSTFGFDRYINQQFYRSKEWKQARKDYSALMDKVETELEN